MNRSVMIVGPLTDEDLRLIVTTIQTIEGAAPEKVFHVLVDAPDHTGMNLPGVELFVERINPLRPGYARHGRWWQL